MPVTLSASQLLSICDNDTPVPVAIIYNFSQIERSWLADKVTGIIGTVPVNDIKRRYYVSQIGGASADVNSLVDLERQWLRKDITDNSGVPNGGELSDLWKQALAARGLRVSQFIDENKKTYYLNVA